MSESSRPLVVALAYFEAHGREFRPWELRAAAHHFAAPWRGPLSHDLAQVIKSWPWSSEAAARAIPLTYAGDASEGDKFFCAEYGCNCGFSYAYSAGEPMGVPA
jgi:hypothetical protein